MKLVLGVDTSCYTTSVALLTADGTLVADERRPLAVKPGARGLAQSEMVYQHTRTLPELFTAAAAAAGGRLELAAVAASVQPRPLPESYMPAFLVGAGYARVIAVAQAVPFLSLSHQEGHILAGVWSAGGPADSRFLAVHASGGTTEITLVTRGGGGLTVKLLGGTSDIAAGQFIDRVGVALGLPFPAGPRLEELAAAGQAAPASLPLAARDLQVSFAGPETQARRLLAGGEKPSAVAAGVQACVADSLVRLCRAAVAASGVN
ncbi:MAG TPA: O-sialoglycoprotein endopeptidase, partial [Negativicutes bacterium]|nr:O-sialoglycoprotein endopeptidase [Negativicutes bacterium]